MTTLLRAVRFLRRKVHAIQGPVPPPAQAGAAQPLVRTPAMSREEAGRLVARTKWFHTVELIEGLVTPGLAPAPFSPKRYMDDLGFAQDLAGLKILDIGTYDGAMAFELAQRGADVVAVDIRSPDTTGFNAIKQISGIDIPHLQADVTRLHQHFGAEFDHVLYLGVFYHLKDPLGAFESIARVIKPGGILHSEGESYGRYFENTEGVRVAPKEVEKIFSALEALDTAGVPVCMAYPGTYVGGHNWFLPNRSALNGWLDVTGFEVERTWMIDTPSGSRRVLARARRRA
jgi:SAM-dependent methyltransferase